MTRATGTTPDGTTIERAAPIVSVADVHVHRGDVLALCDVDLDVRPGRSLAVIGPNGSGKSTLLAVMAGLVEPERGTVSRNGTTALVLQSTDVDRSLPITVRETVALARYPSVGLFRRFRAEDDEAIDRAMERLEVSDLEGRQLHELSGGQRQRVLVAQGLAQGADLLLLDEPVNGLDVASREVILDVLDEERAEGRAVVITTHDLEEAGRCDRVLLLQAEVIAYGTPEEVLVEEHMRRAFGGRLTRVDGGFVLDDPHHHVH